MLAKTVILSVYAIAGVFAMSPIAIASKSPEDLLSDYMAEAATRKDAEADRIQQTRPPRG